MQKHLCTFSFALLASLWLSSINLVVAQRPIQKPKPPEEWQTPGKIQTPGEIQTPKGKWQAPGEIQVPKGIQAIRTQNAKCQQRLTVGADALFEFDKATLTADAEETLKVLGPMIAKAGAHPVQIEGHTDAKGADDYNQRLSEQRAQAVKDWLIARSYAPAATTTKGFGETKPVAPNTKPGGADDPAGRQKNRRVEVVIDTCH